jgi:hypothetical protein
MERRLTGTVCQPLRMHLEKTGISFYKEGMTTVKEIEEAVEKLPSKSLSQFRNWFETFEAAWWDQQFESDANNGRLDLLVNEAKDEYKTEKTSSL